MLPHASIYVALYGIMLMILTFNVSLVRKKNNVSLGGGNHLDLQRAIRTHGNFVEYAAFFALLLVVMDVNRCPPVASHSAGAMFLFGRLLHAVSMLWLEVYVDGKLTKLPTVRIAGMVLTMVAMLLAIVSILLHLPPA